MKKISRTKSVLRGIKFYDPHHKPFLNDVPEDEAARAEMLLKKISKTKNVLRGTRSYLIGPMEYLNGEGWRNEIKEKLSGRGIKFYDPYHKPFLNDVPEDEAARAEMLHWRETEQYDLVSARMKAVRGYDLRLCDVCDWFVAVIKPNIASWGSAEEITTLIREKKTIFLVIDDPLGKKVCPLWLFGVLPHKYIYNSLEDAIDTIKAIDDGIVKISNDKFKLLKPEYR